MNIEYRSMVPGEEKAVSAFIGECFNRFVAPDYIETGVKEFFNYIEPQQLQKRSGNDHFVLVALDNNKIIGAIEVRSYNHISLLFVKTEYQNKGIAKKLIGLSADSSKLANPHLDYIEVNSSPYAVNIYEKLGFRRTGEEQETNGIRFTPMKLKI